MLMAVDVVRRAAPMLLKQAELMFDKHLGSRPVEKSLDADPS